MKPKYKYQSKNVSYKFMQLYFWRQKCCNNNNKLKWKTEYLDLARELKKKTAEDEDNSDTNHRRSPWNNQEELGKETKREIRRRTETVQLTEID